MKKAPIRGSSKKSFIFPDFENMRFAFKIHKNATGLNMESEVKQCPGFIMVQLTQRLQRRNGGGRSKKEALLLRESS
jgi:hypothetical protein